MIKMNLEQARNLKLGAIYVLKGTYEKVRLLHIWPCKSALVENAKGVDLDVAFERLLYANDEEVKNFLEAVDTHNFGLWASDQS